MPAGTTHWRAIWRAPMGTRGGTIGRGLAAAEAGVGTLISYSTQPGNVALDGTDRNSPFARALVEKIAAPGEDLSAVLIDVRRAVMAATRNRQVPWEHSALTGRFYFNPKNPSGSAQSAPSTQERQEPASAVSSLPLAPDQSPARPPTELARGQAPGLSAVVRQAIITRDRISLIVELKASGRSVGIALQEYPMGVAGGLEGDDGTACGSPRVEGIVKLWVYGNYDAGIEDSQFTLIEPGSTTTAVIAFSAAACKGNKRLKSGTLSLPLTFIENRAIRRKANLVIPSIPLTKN